METNTALNGEMPRAATSVRPAVYGRNYSYFSHRIFLAFMPDDFHRYLHELLFVEPSASNPGDLESDNIDVQLVRWVLLHRSQLNALSLNRLLEAWRGSSDVLDVPEHGQLRSGYPYRLDISLQFALELELAAAVESPMIQDRPRLQLALLDAAYYISRQRAEQDRSHDRAAEEGGFDLDLSESGRGAFKAYLLHRMNLWEDLPIDIRERARGTMPPLSEAEVNWLYSVAHSIASTLSSGANQADMRKRWGDRLSARWKRKGIPAPDTALFDALLLGDQSPLVGVPVQVDPDLAEQATMIGIPVTSFKYRWRLAQFEQAPWTRSVMEVALRFKPLRDSIADVAALLNRCVHGKSTDARERPVLHLLADTYRLLPTTPAWSAVRERLSNMDVAERGLGNTTSLIDDGNLLIEYAAMLARRTTIETTVLCLQLGAFLAGCEKVGALKKNAATPLAMMPKEWPFALGAICDSLLLDHADLEVANTRIVALFAGLAERQDIKVPPPAVLHDRSALPAAGDEAILAPDLLAKWPEEDWLAQSLRDAHAAGFKLASQKPRPHVAPDDGAYALKHRMQLLVAGAPPITISPSELVAFARGMPPMSRYPLRLERTTFRTWTLTLLQYFKLPKDDKGSSPAKPDDGANDVHGFEVACALSRLGHGSLSRHIRERFVAAEIPPPSELFDPGLFGPSLPKRNGPSSERLALVIERPSNSLTDSWTQPPKRGFVLSVAEESLDLLFEFLAAVWPVESAQPLRIAVESAAFSRGLVNRLETFAKRWPQPAPIWLLLSESSHDSQPNFRTLVRPASADDLWDA